MYIKASKPDNETDRLKDLYQYEILDTKAEKQFDDLTLLASQIFETPMAMISLVDETRQWFKSKIGIQESETARDIAFCAHGILQKECFIVNDALRDLRFAENPLVTSGPKIRFYAGAPLLTENGNAIGMICVNDRQPRRANENQISALKALSRQVVAQFELCRKIKELERSIAERKQAEKDRQAMEVQLRNMHKMEAIGQLAAGIAHEINTPTQYVGDNIRFLQESFSTFLKTIENCRLVIDAAKSGPPPVEIVAKADKGLSDGEMEYLQQQIPAAITETMGGIARITQIVRAMKDFSHPGSQEKALADLNHAIETTITVARNEWKYVADVKLDLSPNLPPIPCFLAEFNQCILNLVVNAAHAIGDVVRLLPGTKGLITVSTVLDENNVEIRVADTGTGIPESAQPHIFEPFFTTKGVGKGTGQGLSIVYGTIVKRHGGSVRFETKIGAGTSFILRLPVRSEPEIHGCASREKTCDPSKAVHNPTQPL